MVIVSKKALETQITLAEIKMLIAYSIEFINSVALLLFFYRFKNSQI